jgi:hypothetical protein
MFEIFIAIQSIDYFLMFKDGSDGTESRHRRGTVGLFYWYQRRCAVAKYGNPSPLFKEYLEYETRQ